MVSGLIELTLRVKAHSVLHAACEQIEKEHRVLRLVKPAANHQEVGGWITPLRGPNFLVPLSDNTWRCHNVLPQTPESHELLADDIFSRQRTRSRC
jgi:hypothetical protein